MDTYLNAHGNFKILHVDYNEIMKDPAPSIDRINQLLGGNLDTEAMNGAIDPTLYRNRA